MWGKHEEGAIEQNRRCASDHETVKAALMADGHLGHSVPIGGVVVYRNAVSPSGVGYDISCGIKGVCTNLRADDIRKDISKIMDQVAREAVFGVGGTSGKAANHPLFDAPTWRDIPEVGKLRQLARGQPGAVGSGNHWVDILEDEEGWVRVAAHLGSRGLRHCIASGFLNLAHGRPFDAPRS